MTTSEILFDTKIQEKQALASKWFDDLRDLYLQKLEEVESIFDETSNHKFTKKSWNREGGGGGVSSVLLNGNVFEKAGVNVSKVYGNLSNEFRKHLPHTENSSLFFATGISVVIHPLSPFVPAAHFNTRFINTEDYWFGGGGDLTPTFIFEEDTNLFHNHFENTCNKYDSSYYSEFKKNCDEYFYLPHRQEPRGVGGIFFDYFKRSSFEEDFNFVKDVGFAFIDAYVEIVKSKMNIKWTNEDKEAQLLKRGRYVEFNLLHDRGTKFGLMTGGNIEAILMSLPPVAKW
jgi:coproporphyrinogen III oxidase